VIAYDAAEGAEEKTRQTVKEVWPTLEQVGLVEGASIDRLTFATSLQEAVQSYTIYTLENHHCYLDEAHKGDPIHVTL